MIDGAPVGVRSRKLNADALNGHGNGLGVDGQGQGPLALSEHRPARLGLPLDTGVRREQLKLSLGRRVGQWGTRVVPDPHIGHLASEPARLPLYAQADHEGGVARRHGILDGDTANQHAIDVNAQAIGALRHMDTLPGVGGQGECGAIHPASAGAVGEVVLVRAVAVLLEHEARKLIDMVARCV